MSDWKSVEDFVNAARVRRCNATIAQLIGGDPNQRMPRVGVCLSGGGWRAMTSACALFDALSTPLAPSETFAGVGGLKMFDVVSHVFGLSGGSWALFTTLAGGSVNPFHQPVDQAQGPYPHPWLHGTKNCFDENVHRYEGLAHMVSKDTVDRACYRSATQQRVGFLSAKAGADTTIAAAMVCDKLGGTLVERWSNFIANDILSFVDARAGVAAAAFQAELPQEPPSSMSSAEVKAMCAKVVEAASTNPSRNIALTQSSARDLIASGDLPFFVCSAIANRPRSANDPRPGPNVRAYDWVEFTPWFTRNPYQGTVVPNTSALHGHFAGPGLGTPLPLHVHHLMAVCGSAFACDVACALPAGVSALVQKHVNISSEPILGGGVTDIVYRDETSNNEMRPFGVCRDAGIDFNVPLPPMLSEAGRQFDVILVHDAGAGSKNAFELQRAIELGYLALMPGQVPPLAPFAPGERVRVYRGQGGFPTIIYFLGLTERGTHQILQSARSLEHDVRRLREHVLKFVLPLMLGELRVAKARLDHGALAAVLPPPPPQLSVVRTSTTRRTISLDNDDEEEADALEGQQNDSMSIKEEGSSSFAVAAARLAHPLNPLAESMVTNAMTLGKINDALDAYLFLENALFGSLPAAKRIASIIALEERAVKTLSLSQRELSELPPITSVLDAPDLCEVLIDFGVLERIQPNQPLGNLSPAWVDFYATTAMVGAVYLNSDVLGRTGLPPACPRDTLSTFPLYSPHFPDTKVWNLIFIAFVKMGAEQALSDLVRESYVAQLQASVRSEPLRDVDSLDQHMARTIVQCCEEIGSDKICVLKLFNELCGAVSRAFPVNPPSPSVVGAAISGSAATPLGAIDFVTTLARHGASSGRTINLVQVAFGASPHVSPPNGESLLGLRFLSSQPAPVLERVCAVVCESAEANPSATVRQQMLQFLRENMQFVVNYAHCCQYALPHCLRNFVAQHLDDHGAVTAILSTEERHAWSYKDYNRAACIQEIWTNGVGSNLFRDWIVEECVNKRQFYWLFLAPRVKQVIVPPNVTPDKAKEAVEFAEKCKRLQLINVPGNLAHSVRGKLGELESKLLGRKDEIQAVVGSVAAKVEDVANAAKVAAIGKVTGFLGRFGK